MTRPLFWALGVVASIGIPALMAPDRLTRLIAGGGYSSPAPTARVAPGGERLLTLQADLRGHYTTFASVNGAMIRTLVDTGASYVALSAEDAQKAGIRPDGGGRMVRLSTANGIVSAPMLRLPEVKVGDLIVRDVEAVIMPRGTMGVSLLGMSFLRGLRGFEVSGGRLIMKG